ncbi:hypothetical protein [Photobacterium damselae]|uniref:hypothetical protein n=1 Tax=Photobacterium damselae TaxID=38293 RepID=UPI000D663B62|nr:hypothetical protein [Photobacterium damselae]AWK84043.1 hypothetical protein BST98_18840 [Photobacterium damselae]
MIIFRILLLLFSPLLMAAISQEQTITLNATIIDNFTHKANLSTTMVGPSFQPLVYNKRKQKFSPIFYRFIVTSAKSINQFSLIVHYKDMTCVPSRTGRHDFINTDPILKVTQGNIGEYGNKITLSGDKYWSVAEFNKEKIYISDINLEVSFNEIEQLGKDSLYCVGYIVLLPSIDL